jgi:hypothetical protein
LRATNKSPELASAVPILFHRAESSESFFFRFRDLSLAHR